MSHHLLGDREVCDAGSGLGRWAPRWYLTITLTLWLLVIAGNWMLSSGSCCCLELQGWEGRRLQAGDHWGGYIFATTGYGIALQKGFTMEEADWPGPCSSLWVMVRLWLTSLPGTGDPHTLCFLTGFPVDLWVMTWLTISIYWVLTTWYHGSLGCL